MGAGGSVIHKTFTDPLDLGAKFAIEIDLVIPAATLAAIGAGSSPEGHGPAFCAINAGGSSTDSAYIAQVGGRPLSWSSFNNVYGSVAPTNEIDVVGDAAVTVRYDADDSGGSGSSTDLWNVSWKAGGTIFDASPYAAFGGTGPALGTIGNLDIWLGAYDAATDSSIVYLITGFRLYDSTNTLVASSDWSSGDWTTDGWSVLFGAASLSVIEYPPAPPPPPSNTRFFEGFPWRFVFSAIDVTDPDNPVVVETTSWADGLLTNRQLAFALGQSSSIEADVWPDDIRVNEVWTDGYPRIAQTKRMVWAFRREGGTPPWVCRAAGMLMSPSDDGGPDIPVTHFVAYDPRTYLGARPAMNADGSLPGPNGFLMVDTGDQVALTMLANTIANEGSVFIDAGVAYGGTSFYGGTIETTADVAMTISAGQSVADVWDALEQAGNCDIILTPIYDPINRPGYTHELSIYALAGSDKPSVVMAWDLLNRCLNRIERVHDGTPGNFFDKVQAYAGQGGVPVPAAGPLTNSAAVTDFGSWWLMQFFPSMLSTDPTAAAVLALATQALELAKQGRRTLTLDVTTELAPRVFNAYGLGDRINVHATRRMRAAIDGLQRVQAIPIQIPDDGVGEKIAALLTSPDYRGAS
jgi:hypothetical protein